MATGRRRSLFMLGREIVAARVGHARNAEMRPGSGGVVAGRRHVLGVCVWCVGRQQAGRGTLLFSRQVVREGGRVAGGVK